MSFSSSIVSKTRLGTRPEAVNNLNGSSYQQDALVTHNGWQYAAFYLDHERGVRHIHLARRRLPTGTWELLEFLDYNQTIDDGHNVISLGISPADGSIHLAWDLHNSTFNYRRSIVDLTSDPSTSTWSAKAFGPVEHTLEGLDQADLTLTTYPRFVSVPQKLGGALLLELRTGIAGLGDDWLYVYHAGVWKGLGIYLKGEDNNAFINGLDIDEEGGLHVTWCYRDYVPTTHEEATQQLGPNGPENNYDLCYAFSPREGEYPGHSWYSSSGNLVGKAGLDPVVPGPAITMFDIPKGSGILNQEAQVISPAGVHVLNRENVGGRSTWFHYHVSRSLGPPTRQALPVFPQSSTSPRGKLVYFRGFLLALLHTERSLVILDLASGNVVGEVVGAGGKTCQEVLYDRYRSDALSLFVGIDGQLVVVDIHVGSAGGSDKQS